MMAGVDLTASYATMPRLGQVIMPNGMMHTSALDVSDVQRIVREGLRERALTLGDVMMRAARWVTPWGVT